MHARPERVANLLLNRPAHSHKSTDRTRSEKPPLASEREGAVLGRALWVVEPDLVPLARAAVRILEPGRGVLLMEPQLRLRVVGRGGDILVAKEGHGILPATIIAGILRRMQPRCQRYRGRGSRGSRPSGTAAAGRGCTAGARRPSVGRAPARRLRRGSRNQRTAGLSTMSTSYRLRSLEKAAQRFHRGYYLSCGLPRTILSAGTPALRNPAENILKYAQNIAK